MLNLLNANSGHMFFFCFPCVCVCVCVCVCLCMCVCVYSFVILGGIIVDHGPLLFLLHCLELKLESRAHRSSHQPFPDRLPTSVCSNHKQAYTENNNLLQYSAKHTEAHRHTMQFTV